MKFRTKRDRPRCPETTGLEQADMRAIHRVTQIVGDSASNQTETDGAQRQPPVRATGRGRRNLIQWLTLMIAGLALIALMPGWVVPVTVCLAVLTIVSAYCALGHERVCALVEAWYGRLKRRDPERAENLRARAAHWSKQLTNWTATLPESWTQGLYIPDFEPEQDKPELLETDPSERLSVKP